MQMSYKKRIDDIFKKLDTINMQGLQIVLDIISDLEKDNPCLYFKIKLLDKDNNIIISEDIENVPREYIERYIDKYKIIPRIDFYNIVNNKLIYVPSLSEQDTYKNDLER